jgi:hypothetical protein
MVPEVVHHAMGYPLVIDHPMRRRIDRRGCIGRRRDIDRPRDIGDARRRIDRRRRWGVGIDRRWRIPRRAIAEAGAALAADTSITAATAPAILATMAILLCRDSLCR